MSELFTISSAKVLHHLKLSCQVPSVIEGILSRKIITTTAKQQSIKAEPEELQQAADNLRLANNLKSAEATWLWLQKHSLSLDDFEELAEVTVLSSKLAQFLFVDKVESFFVEHQLDYAQVVMYEVILDNIDLAMELFYALTEGEISFHEVARQYSQNVELRRSGGYLGKVSRTALKPEVSAAVFAASPPQILKPITSAKGVHLILVEELIQPQINDTIRYQIISDLFSKWLKQEIDKFDFAINWGLDDLETTNSRTKLITGVS